MERVFGTGGRCFQGTHYLFESEDHCPIPMDASPINCVISHFVIYGVGSEAVPEGVLPPRKIGNMIHFTIGYQIRTWYEFYSTDTRTCEVKVAGGAFEKELVVPLRPTGLHHLLLDNDDCTLFIKKITLDAVRAELTPRPEGFSESFSPYAIQVTVEKEFFVLTIGKAIVCVSSCNSYLEGTPAFPGDLSCCCPADQASDGKQG
jgi:hypothetical protein